MYITLHLYFQTAHSRENLIICISVCPGKYMYINEPCLLQGAGDAFVGALASFLVSHSDQPMSQIIGAACYVATLSVTKEGTQTSYPTKFDAFKKEYKYKHL